MLSLKRVPGKSAFLLASAEAGRDEERYICKLAACRSPFCACTDLTMTLAPCSPSSSARWPGPDPIEVTVDPFGRSHEPKASEMADAAAAEFGHAIASALGEEHWDVLRRAFLARKRRAMESLDPDGDPFPFPFDAIEKHGELAPYQQVFPFAKPIFVAHDGIKFLVDDHYCLKPGCDCTEVLLAFCPVGASPRLRARYSLRLDLRTGGWTDERTEERPQGEAAELARTVTARRGGLVANLEARRTFLRRIYAASKAKLYQERPEPPIPPKAPGRNDPCPCGSGRKYKRCCRSRVPAA